MNLLYSFKSEWLKKKRSLASWLVIVGAFFTPVIITIAKLVNNGRLYAESTSKNFWEVLLGQFVGVDGHIPAAGWCYIGK